jgi:flagellar biosynthesis protein FlhF
MHVKRLYRPTIREALRAAREQLGPDALVLSTEVVRAPGLPGWFGRRVVRLTAAAERPVSEARPLVPAGRHRSVDAARQSAVAKLVAAGLDSAFAESVVDQMTDAECRHALESVVRRALSTALGPLAGGDEPYAHVEVFVGPPGAGKTTTIAKIAAQERARGGPTLNLVAADGFRAGAVEQLRSYAAVLGAPFRSARSALELDEALAAARCTALVDTAGRSPADGGLVELVAVLAGYHGVRTHLVIAADTSPASARRLFDRYASLRPSRVAITKLDEAHSVAPLVGVVRERGLPISYLTAGQRVPEDLCRATPATLAAVLLPAAPAEASTCH